MFTYVIIECPVPESTHYADALPIIYSLRHVTALVHAELYRHKPLGVDYFTQKYFCHALTLYDNFVCQHLAGASLGISLRVVKLLADHNSRVVKRVKLGFCYTYIQKSRVVN